MTETGTNEVAQTSAHGELTGIQERTARRRGSSGGSTSAEDTSVRNPLLGTERSPSVRKKCAVPPKPPPPPTTSEPRKKLSEGVLNVEPYDPSPRSCTEVATSPPMARSGGGVALPSRVTTLNERAFVSASSSNVAIGNGVCGPTQPRNRKTPPNSPGTRRPSLPPKPKPPPVRPPPPVRQTIVRPPAATPRKTGHVSQRERRISGEGCEEDTQTTHTSNTSSATDQCSGDVTKSREENSLGMRTTSVLTRNGENTALNHHGREGSAVESTVRNSAPNRKREGSATARAIESTLPTAKSERSKVRPPLPPRISRRTGSIDVSSSPSPPSSRKASLPAVLRKPNGDDGVQHNDIQTVVKRKETLLQSKGKETSLQSKGASGGQAVVLRRKDGLASSPPSQQRAASLLPLQEEDSSVDTKKYVKRLTMHFEGKQTPSVPNNRTDTTRRNTLPDRPTKPPPYKLKPVLLSNALKPPIPLPRTTLATSKEDIQKATADELLGSPKRSLLRKRAKYLTASTPSLLTLVDKDSPSRSHTLTTGSSLAQARKASSVSPKLVHSPVKQPQNSNQPLLRGVGGRTTSVSSSQPPKPPRRYSTPPKLPPKRFSKSSSVSDILEVDDVTTSTTLRDVVAELKSTGHNGALRGNREGGVAVRGEEERNLESRGERLEPEGAEDQPTSESPLHSQNVKRENRLQTLGAAKPRAVSVGDISMLAQSAVPHQQMHHPTVYSTSDASSYASSEGRGSVMSSDTHSVLLDRARQLSQNKKWSEQPEVRESDLLSSLKKEQIFLQEAIFEIVTSEATYHLNLAMLIDHFMDDPKMDPNGPDSERVLDRTQHSILFSNVKEIRRVSTMFLEELLGLFADDVFLRRIFPILEDYAKNKFVCYERYCASQSHRLKELMECRENSESFERQLKKLEEEANQTLQSLVTAPMQRVTKLPLLMSEILKRTPHDDPSRGQMELTQRATEEIADLCNRGAGKIGDLIHLETIWKKLNFGQLKPFLILSPGRTLKKEGTIERLKVNRRKSRVTPDKIQHYLFVFTDLLMITTEDKDRHHVVDYCPLANLTVDAIQTNQTHSLELSSSSEDGYTMSVAEWIASVAGEEHAFLVTARGNAVAASGKQGGSSSETSYIFVVKSEAEKTKWMDVLKDTSTEGVTCGRPKALLAGRNVTLLKKKRRKNPPTKKHWWKQHHIEQSGVVKMLSQQQLELQEAIFEVVTSEEEHLVAMETLVKHYMSDSGLDPSLPEEQRVLSEEEYNNIFRNVCDVRDISAGLLKSLLERQKENLVVDSISDVLLLCIERNFQGYIRYCTNLPYQMEQLDNSIEKNEPFRGYLKQLEEDQCPLRSLLNAPGIRVRQLLELVRNILRKTPSSGLTYSLIESTIRALEKVVQLCTSGQQKVEKILELHSLEGQLDFGNHRPFALGAVGRSLVKRGHLTKLKVTQWFGKTVKRKQIYIIVLTDCLLITKKIENVYKITDMCSLDRVIVEVIEPHALDHNASFTGGGEDALIGAKWAISKAGENFGFFLSFPDVKRSYTFVTVSEEERAEWVESLSMRNLMSFDDHKDTGLMWDYFYMEAVRDYCPEAHSGAVEDLEMRKGGLLRVYRVTNEWCEGLRARDLNWGRVPVTHLTRTQRREGGEGEEVGARLVEATHDFPGSELGELQLEKGDVVKLARQISGWCEGKKLRGNQWGWFPSTFMRQLNTSRTHISSSPVFS